MFLFCDGTFYPVLFRASYGHARQALLVWSKQRIGMGREFRKSHELILHLWRDDTECVTGGPAHPDVITCAPIVSGDRVHPAEKPTSLIEQLLWCCKAPILDPFMGSGSTLLASRDMGLQSIGIEIEEKYCEIAAKRLSQGVLF